MCALYLTYVLKMKPRIYSWLKIFLYSQLLIPVVGIINITIDSNYVKKNLGELVKDTDLSKFIL